jgi:general secretion pathway protein D
MKRFAAILVLGWCAWPFVGMAADSEATASASESRSSHDVDLRALIREVGAREHKRIVWDPRLPQQLDIGNLERQDITYARLLALLRIHGFVVVADDGVLEVIPDALIRFEAAPLVSPDNIKTLDNEWVTTILPLKGISAIQLVTILRPLVPTNGQITALAERNAMLIIDRSDNVRRLVELARALEKLPSTIPAAATP